MLWALCLTLLTLVPVPIAAGAQAPLGRGYSAWLAYRPVDVSRVFGAKDPIPDSIVVLGADPLEQSAARELFRGWHGMLGHDPRLIESEKADLSQSPESAVIVGTQEQVRALRAPLAAGPKLAPDAYRLYRKGQMLLVEGGDARGTLYGAFALLRDIAEEHSLQSLDENSSPWAATRWTNEWDNPGGTIERGYGGPSFFFKDGTVLSDLTRAAGYARLLASVGIDGCVINNVNADPRLLLPENLKQIARIADAFRPYGVQLALSVDIASPQDVGGLPTFDPLDPRVVAWWRSKMDEVYQLIPDFGGVLVKADSEGQPGPSHYGRSPADAANVLARALAPHGGVVMYRAFVYNHHLDWHDMKADRARAAYDIFHPLDGKFDSNVIVQIKNGPIDFQVREPVSPLFAGLPHTNEAIELQITQEYLGQQRHLVYLAPMWKVALDTDMRRSPNAAPLTVSDLIRGHSIAGDHHTLGGFVGVADAGTDRWLGSPLALANLYSFGRLAWNPTLSAAKIADEWTRLTFGNDPTVLAVVNKLQMNSWHIYESYTGNLGIGTLTDILGPHFGPNPASAERNGWGQWFRADHQGVGMDRTVKTGTGYIGQYPAPLAAEYESLKSCPDNLLLFMHHVPYTYRLHSGKTVIQFIYDSHYWGAKAAAEQVPEWESLRGKVPDAIYKEMLKRLKFQEGHAIVWRDAITQYFARISEILDDQHRVGHYPGRTASYDMKLDGYTQVQVKPWETASDGKAAECVGHPQCSASLVWSGDDGWYNVAVDYYDLRRGASQLTLQVAGNQVDQWLADENLPDQRMNGNSETRHTVRNVALHRGDTVSLIGRPDAGEPAPFDYIEITPAKNRAEGSSNPRQQHR